MKLHTIDPKLLIPAAPAAEGAGKRNDPEALRRTCAEFEAVFIQQMFKGMRTTIPQDGILQKSSAQQMFEEMMDVEVARQAALEGKFGIGEALFRQLLRQEASDAGREGGEPEK